jgi:hypothetical protein
MNSNGHQPGGSMFGPQNAEELEAKLAEQVTMTRGALADHIHNGVMELMPEMQAEYDSLEQQVTALEADNLQLRRDITALKHK